MLNGINLKKCLVCGDKITSGLFCVKHVRTVENALAMVHAPVVDTAKLKAEAEARYAALQKAKTGKP